MPLSVARPNVTMSLPKEGARGKGTREIPGLEFRHPELRGCRVLRTLGDALQARDELDAVSMRQTGPGKLPGQLGIRP